MYANAHKVQDPSNVAMLVLENHGAATSPNLNALSRESTWLKLPGLA